MRLKHPLSMAVLASSCLLVACTRPAVAPKPLAFQDSADALRDWEAVAKQIATDMTRDGMLPAPGNPSIQAPPYPYYIHVVTSKSQFLHEVKASLAGEIVRRGGTVVRGPAGAAVIDLDVDVVQWNPADRLPDGTLTKVGLAGGAAVVLANQAPLTAAAGFGILAGVGILADVARTMTPSTNTEIAWGASISLDNRVVFDVRYPMYIAEADKTLYTGVPDIVGPPPVRLRYAP